MSKMQEFTPEMYFSIWKYILFKPSSEKVLQSVLKAEQFRKYIFG